MLDDRYGLPVSTKSTAARDAYIAGCDCVLSAEHGGFEHLATALAADPRLAVAHAALARSYFLIADIAQARSFAAQARQLAPQANPREQSHINALCLPIEGKGGEALAAVQAHVKDYPRDAMIASLATGVFGLIGFSGRQERETEQVAFLEALRPHLDNDWWFQALYAFALAEIGRLDQALALIEQSLSANPRNAHAVHIKAHVLYEQGENAHALRYLDSWLPSYPRQGLMHCHLSWHVALCALEAGDTDRAWSVYERQVQPGGAWGPPLNICTDAPSFLWRAEFAGHARKAEHWQILRAYTDKSFPKAGIAFVDVHRALTHIVTGDSPGIAQLIAGLEQVATRSPAGNVVVELAKGLVAYAQEDWLKAVAVLEPALAQTVRIGGSRAQRDVIVGTLMAAYLRSGRANDARRLIAAQSERRPAFPLAGLS